MNAVNYILILIWLFMLFFFLKKELIVATLAFVFIRQSIFTIPSLIYIIKGGYISEQRVYGYDNGALIIYLLYILYSLVIVTLAFHHIFLRIKFSGIKINKLRVDDNIEGIAILVLSILMVNLLLSPVPLFNVYVDRFAYFENSKFPFLRKIFGDVALFIPFICGIVYLKKKKRGVLLLIIYLVYIILIGQKFGPIISTVLYFIIPSILLKRIDFKFRYILNFKILIIPFILFGAVYYSYSVFNPYKYIVGDSIISAIFYRLLGLQGHVWWGAVEYYVTLGKAHTYDIFEMREGMTILMAFLFPGDISKAIERGVSFTNAYPGILLRVFPIPLALIIHSFLLVKLAIMSKILYELVLSKNYLLSVVMFQNYTWYLYMLSMGTFSKIGITFTITLLFLLVSKFKIGK